MPTLPQRDIFEQLVKPNILRKSEDFTEIKYKNVEKLLRLTPSSDNVNTEQGLHRRDDLYIDLNALVNRKEKLRYVKVEDNEESVATEE